MATAAENHGGEWGLVWYFLWGIYTSSPSWTHSQNSLAAAKALILKIFPWYISKMIKKIVIVSTRIVISYAMKQGIPMSIWWKVNGNWDNKMIRISQCRESHCRTNSSVTRKKEIQKSRIIRITLWNPSRKVNPLGNVIWKTITEFTRLISFPRRGKPVLMMGVKVSKAKNISRCVDRENIIYVRWNRIKNCAHSWRSWSIEEKK